MAPRTSPRKPKRRHQPCGMAACSLPSQAVPVSVRMKSAPRNSSKRCHDISLGAVSVSAPHEGQPVSSMCAWQRERVPRASTAPCGSRPHQLDPFGQGTPTSLINANIQHWSLPPQAAQGALRPPKAALGALPPSFSRTDRLTNVGEPPCKWLLCLLPLQSDRSCDSGFGARCALKPR